MIQDIPSPEMYLSRLPGGRCGGWSLYEELATPNSIHVNFRDLRECSVFWAITVPGESQWYAERLEGTIFNKGHTHPSYPPPLVLSGMQFRKHHQEHRISPAIPTRFPILNQQTSVSYSRRGPRSPAGFFSSSPCRCTTEVWLKIYNQWVPLILWGS